MYTAGIIANSQKMLTEIKESGAIAKIMILAESNIIHEFLLFWLAPWGGT